MYVKEFVAQNPYGEPQCPRFSHVVLKSDDLSNVIAHQSAKYLLKCSAQLIIANFLNLLKLRLCFCFLKY